MRSSARPTTGARRSSAAANDKVVIGLTHADDDAERVLICYLLGAVASRFVEIVFTKLSDERHSVAVERVDGTTETVELDSRSFLRHDLAHFAVERELGLADAVWGSVARGGSLSGDGLDGEDIALAETISGPMQTMMRIGASPEQIHEAMERIAPARASVELAGRLHVHIRSLEGQWAATTYGGHMRLRWPENPPT